MLHARRRNPISDCPITAAMAAIGGKWKLQIVYWLSESPLHFAALRHELFDISQKVLTEQLGELIADDIVEREQIGKVPAPVIYSLTDYGRTVLPLLERVRAWGNVHIARFTE
jgi:DNA-binding HxlR family transcriptional regulator